MISPDILKRAAAAGALGAAVLSGAVLFTPARDMSGCEFGHVDSNQPIEVSYVPEDRYDPPVARRAPPPEGASRGAEQAPGVETRAATRARHDAMRRAVERLARLKRLRREGAVEVDHETVRRLERRLDRAIDAAARTSLDD